jgi:uncharacterized protein (TIGR00297 family)
MSGFSEVSRQLTHILAGSFALLLRWTTWWQSALLAVVALLFNVLVLPALGKRVFRPGDLDRVMRSGIAIYPLSVLALILAFPMRPDIVAISWGVLAAGDGLATMIGAHWRTTALPWNPAKSVGGLTAGVLGGALAGLGLAWWTAQGMSSPPPPWFLVAAPLLAALVAGFVETAPIGLNDNISVPCAAALVLWSLTFVDGATFSAAGPVVTARLAPALAVNTVFAFLGWRARTVTVPGALTGAAIGVATWLSAGLAGWTVLFGAFAMASAATRLGHARKALLGIAEGRGGRRGPGNAIANTSVAAWCAVLALGMPAPAAAWLAGVAALATAASDTVASEVGKAWGRNTWLITQLRPVPPGTSGAISIEGTLAGALSAALLATLAAWLGLISAAAILPVALAATLACFAEGWLSVRFEGAGLLDNDALNFLNSLIGAALALLWWSLR